MTPTLSMRLANQGDLERWKKKRRSDAAKKAWQTRLKRRIMTPIMADAMTWLGGDGCSIRQERDDFWGCRVYTSGPGIHPRFTKQTFWALLKRGWLAQSGRAVIPGEGQQDRVIVWFSITDRGRRESGHRWVR